VSDRTVSDRDALLDAFASGDLVRPSSDHMSFVDVVRALAHASGVSMPLNEHSRDLASHLKNVDHLIFLFADGLGINLIDHAPRNSWLRSHTRRAILAPFPSTTTTAVTSFFTGETAAVHSVIGWWIHVPEINSTATVFQNDHALDGKPLGALGAGVEQLFPTPTWIGNATREIALVMPEGIVETPYTRHAAGDAARIGYRDHQDAVGAITQFIQQSSGPTLTYWYSPSPDTEEHDVGAESSHTLAALSALDAAAERLSSTLDELHGSWRLVGTADHGHLALEPRLEIEEQDALLPLLTAPPAGDMRVQCWHVRDDATDEFEQSFRGRFGEAFYLLTTAEFEELRLLGDESWSDATRARVGTHVSISRGGAALRYAGIPGGAGYRKMHSGHSGLSPAEMRIPLIIAGEETKREDYGL